MNELIHKHVFLKCKEGQNMHTFTDTRFSGGHQQVVRARHMDRQRQKKGRDSHYNQSQLIQLHSVSTQGRISQPKIGFSPVR